MLLGHYLRGLEYRMELMQLLSLTSDAENNVCGDGQVAWDLLSITNASICTETSWLVYKTFVSQQEEAESDTQM